MLCAHAAQLERSIPWRKQQPKDPYPVAGAGGKGRWASVRDAIRGSCNIYAAQYINGGAYLGGIVAVRASSVHAVYLT